MRNTFTPKMGLFFDTLHHAIFGVQINLNANQAVIDLNNKAYSNGTVNTFTGSIHTNTIQPMLEYQTKYNTGIDSSTKA